MVEVENREKNPFQPWLASNICRNTSAQLPSQAAFAERMLEMRTQIGDPAAFVEFNVILLWTLITIYWHFVHFRCPQFREKTPGKLTMLTLTAGGSSMSSSLKHVHCYPRWNNHHAAMPNMCETSPSPHLFYGITLEIWVEMNGEEWTSSQTLVFKVDSTLVISQRICEILSLM